MSELNTRIIEDSGFVLHDNNIRATTTKLGLGGKGLKGDQGELCDPRLYDEPNEENAEIIELWINETFRSFNIWWGRSLTIDPYEHADILATPEWTAGYRGGVLIPDNRVALIPHNQTKVNIFDIKNKTFVATQTLHGEVAVGAFSGGVLLPDKRICLIPYESTKVSVYSIENDIYTATNHMNLIAPFYDGGVLLPDGRVCMIPSHTGNMGLFNPSTNTFETGAGFIGETIADGVEFMASDATRQYSGGVLLPNGHVLLVPYSNPNLRIYDPIENEFTITSPIPNELLNNNERFFVGGVLGPNNVVYLVPYNASNIGVYDITANEWIIVDGAPDNALNKYASGVLLRNGNLLCIPHSAAAYLEFNPDGNTKTYHTPITTPTATLDRINNAKYYGGVVTEEGSVCVIPYSANYLDLIDMNDGNLMDKNTSYSPLFNKL